jgi:hypothetical protein
MTDPAPISPEEARRRGRIKLILFGALLAITATFFVTTGMVMRSKLQAMAGPLLVTVENKSTTKLRADIVVEGRPTTLEMDPGERGLVRYNIKSAGVVRLDVFERNSPVNSIAEGPFQPGEEAEVLFTLLGTDEVEVTTRTAGEGT